MRYVLKRSGETAASSAAFYGPLQGLEIALRNAIHQQLTRCYSAAWHDNPAVGRAPRPGALLGDALQLRAGERGLLPRAVNLSAGGKPHRDLTMARIRTLCENTFGRRRAYVGATTRLTDAAGVPQLPPPEQRTADRFDGADCDEMVRAAEQGDAQTQISLGVMYATGRGVQRDDAEAVRWFRRAAEQGNAKAQNNVGVMLLWGGNVPFFSSEITEWFQLAAEQGHVVAQANLGVIYSRRGLLEAAARWYRLAAEQGDAHAQCALGVMCEKYEDDDAEAARWYRLAAEQGDAHAQISLGVMCEGGYGVQPDDIEAVRWYRLAAEQGDERGSLTLAHRYATGRGVQRDDAEAVRWYRLAAEQGDAHALTELGVMYETGRGVRQDDAEAVRWSQLAVDKGDTLAQKTLDRLRGLSGALRRLARFFGLTERAE